MSGNDAGVQQGFRPALELAAGYLEDILHVMQDSEDGHVSCRFRVPPAVGNVGFNVPLPVAYNISDPCDTGQTNQSIASSGTSVSEKTDAFRGVGESNEISFLSQSSTQRRTGDSANLIALSDSSSQDCNGGKLSPWPAGTATTVPTPTEFNALGDTMADSERVAVLERAFLDALHDEGLPEETAQRVLHRTMRPTSTLPERNEGKLDHEREYGELAQCREAMRQQAGENEHLRSQLETSEAQLRKREGELAEACRRELAQCREVMRQQAGENEHLRSQLETSEAQLRKREGELAEACRRIEELSGALRALELHGETDHEDASLHQGLLEFSAMSSTTTVDVYTPDHSHRACNRAPDVLLA